MPINSSLVYFYAPVSGDGGTIDLAAKQTSSLLLNEFSNVTDANRIAGVVDYRKQFVRNENPDPWTDVKAWVSVQPPAGDTIALCQAGTLSLLTSTVSLGSATFATATALVFATTMHGSIRPGEKVYDATNDPTGTTLKAITEVSTSSGLVYLATAFGGATTGTHTIVLAPATQFDYVTPTWYDDAVSIGTIGSMGYAGTWKRRTVPALTNGYVNDYFTVVWGSGPV